MCEQDGERVKESGLGLGRTWSPESRRESSMVRLGPDLLKGSALKSPVIRIGELGGIDRM